MDRGLTTVEALRVISKEFVTEKKKIEDEFSRIWREFDSRRIEFNELKRTIDEENEKPRKRIKTVDFSQQLEIIQGVIEYIEKNPGLLKNC
ncbi:MAG: hypothetical protein OEL89_05490, partial [Candidatus Peregrinibacteria bacterium]|nr:hypothetical protein [Candidatus Peregrinibacteria bacterium]